MSELERDGIILLGCGRMGSALLSGWLNRGIPPQSISVIEPQPSDWLRSQPVKLNPGPGMNQSPAVCLLAIKPQIAGEAITSVRHFGGGSTLFLSILAGTQIAFLESEFGPGTPVVRTMPNTPAAIGSGITAITGNRHCTADHIDLAEQLMAAVGDTVRIEDEELMDAVTALSGSGPAYVFHMVEAMTAAGEEMGFKPDVAKKLAVATVAGAGGLLTQPGSEPGELRKMVTSPGGTTEAALEVLMDPETGLRPLMSRCIWAAHQRGRELGKLHD